MNQSKSYFKYWGKARKKEDGDIESHPLYLHSLDVVAVAHEWWNHSSAIRNSFMQETGFLENQIQALVLFFIALHDYGKLDMRFQNKVPEIAPYNTNEVNTNYDHGEGGYKWFVHESDILFENCNQKRYLQNWLAHTAGHHGTIPNNAEPNFLPSYVPKEERRRDQIVREYFVKDMEKLFLKPQCISLENMNIQEQPPVLLAGFCAVCDWLGSNTDYFKYATQKEITESQHDLSLWFNKRREKAQEVLKKFGLLTEIITQGGMNQIYPELRSRNVQTLIPKLKIIPSLIIMEASTGSGKTEAAIAFASKLLAKGFADSISFALPSQATANAILPRLRIVSEKIFSSGQNVILAHGKSPYNQDFKKLIKNSFEQTGAEGNKAIVQCNEWLAVSRKRAFLGQIAVTTVDQVLLSTITSLKHYFIRSFGIGKSVLIIDEVHAYDAYMYGLLKKVIKSQKQIGGSVILLSATLPWFQKEQLLKTWDSSISMNEDHMNKYPLILQSVRETNKDKKEYSSLRAFSLDQDERHKKTFFELWRNNNMSLDENELEKIANTVKQKSAKVGIICNLVNDAQVIAERLMEREISVDIFHSRYRYKDRMKKEKSVIQKYGKDSKKDACILVGTQVLEQSLDIDFDWLITYLCPMDLLFQRIGRLHRHEKQRPEGFEKAFCSIVVPEKDKWDYKTHEYIYKNKRALWRTQQLLYGKESLGYIIFPKAYREWIEKVYQRERWTEEPENIIEAFRKYKRESDASQSNARLLTSVNTFFNDTDENAAILTREGEMNLSVVPVIEKNGAYYFLEGEAVPNVETKDKRKWEELYQNTIPVPKSWECYISAKIIQGFYYLRFTKIPDREEWQSETCKGYRFSYTLKYGLKKENLC